MREYHLRSGALRRLPLGGRLLYTAFLLFCLAGLVSALALYQDSLGLGLTSVQQYYLGNADDPQATELLFEKSPRELWEVTHFHLFTMPVLLLVLGHLFMLARGGAWRGPVLAVAVLATALHVAGPWIVRFLGLGLVMPLSGVLLLGSYLVMIAWSGLDMWRP